MGAEKKLLVVDDSKILREIISRIVTDLGFEAIEAEDVKSAASVCAENALACVFLDWDLPLLGALDFLRDVAELPEDRRPTIILCATENDVEQFRLAKAAGAAFHILKPYDKDTIVTILREVGVLTENMDPASAVA